MVQPVFFAVAKPVWDGLNAEQKKAFGDASLKAAKTGDEARLADEAAVVAALKGRGLTVDGDRSSRRSARRPTRIYADSDLAKQWDAAGLQRAQKA